MFQNRGLRGTYRHSPTYPTVNVPESLAQVGTYGQVSEGGPVEIQLRHTGIRSSAACAIAHLRFTALSFPHGKIWRALQNYLFEYCTPSLIIIIIIIIIT